MRRAGSRQIWHQDGLTVSIHLTDEGDLRFAGHDLSGHPFSNEYEYWVTIPAVDVPIVVSALGGRPGDNVLELMADHAATIVRRGERAWVESLGIEPSFFAR
jgi:hypothetical protein